MLFVACSSHQLVCQTNLCHQVGSGSIDEGDAALPAFTPVFRHQPSTAAAVATKVLMKARAAKPLASRAEPALKPNQPTHSIAAPKAV